MTKIIVKVLVVSIIMSVKQVYLSFLQAKRIDKSLVVCKVNVMWCTVSTRKLVVPQSFTPRVMKCKIKLTLVPVMPAEITIRTSTLVTIIILFCSKAMTAVIIQMSTSKTYKMKRVKNKSISCFSGKSHHKAVLLAVQLCTMISCLSYVDSYCRATHERAIVFSTWKHPSRKVYIH